MTKYDSVAVNVERHPGAKGFWIISQDSYTSDDAEPNPWGEPEEVKSRSLAILKARSYARYFVDGGEANRATVYVDGAELHTYLPKKATRGRHRAGGKKRHGKFKLVAARKGTVLDRVKAASFGTARRKYRAKGHAAPKKNVAVVRYGGKKRHSGIGTQVAELQKLLK